MARRPMFLASSCCGCPAGVDVALAIVGVAVIIAVTVFLRRNEARLQREVDRAMPGPLEPTR